MSSNYLYSYNCYKHFIRQNILKDSERGMTKRLAKAIGVHVPYLSKVLNGDSHLSFDQMQSLCSYLNFNNKETRYMISLLHYERAGTDKFKSYWKEEIINSQNENLKLENNLNDNATLTREQEIYFYSEWENLAIFVLSSIKGLNTLEQLATTLHVSTEQLIPRISKLKKMGVIIKRGKNYTPGKKKLHLSTTSPLIKIHHTNWRLKAMEYIKESHKDNLNFSTIYSFSENDINRIKKEIRKLLLEISTKSSKTIPEKAVCLNIDFFTL